MLTKKKPMKRREFLAWMTAATGASMGLDPISTIINAVSSKAISQAFAENIAKTEIMKYCLIQEYGAPPRQFFDLFLNPNGESIDFHPMMSNAYSASGGKYTEGRFLTTEKKGYTVPHLWNLKTSAGGRPIAQLLDNMLTVQGVYGLNFSHNFNAAMMTQPVPGGPSLGGLAADFSNAQLGAVAVGHSLSIYAYKSPKGKTILQSSSSGVNQAHNLFVPFKRDIANSMKAKVDSAEDEINAAIKSLNVINQKYNRVMVDHEGAKAIAKTAIGNYFETWQPLFQKYTNLIKAAFVIDNSLKYIADKPIGVEDRARDKRYSITNGVLANIGDLRNGIASDTTIFMLAENFATAEFLLTNGYTNSFRMGTTHTMNNTKFNGNRNIVNDQHYIGYMSGILINNLHYRAYAACLLELIDQLKAKTDPDTGRPIFDDTLIHYGGEFNRNPVYIGHPNQYLGTSHGATGISASFFSGRIQGLQVIGDTVKSHKVGSRDYKTWGYGARHPDLNNERINYGQMANTVAAMLNVPPLVTASDSVVKREAGKIQPLIRRSQLV